MIANTCVRTRTNRRRTCPLLSLCPVCGAGGLPVPGEWIGELETTCRGCGVRLVVSLRSDGGVEVRVGELCPSSDRGGWG